MVEWADFLRRWSETVLENPNTASAFDAKVRESLWLGYPGATEAELVATEERLGARLPPSYREFLGTSNGWRTGARFVSELSPTTDIDWFRNRHTEIIRTWVEETERLGAWPVSDERYLVYGKDQLPHNMRVEYLASALQISPVDEDGEVYLLNPEIIDSNGEWEAWFFAPWLAGANRYRSFWDLMNGQFSTQIATPT